MEWHKSSIREVDQEDKRGHWIKEEGTNKCSVGVEAG